MTTNEIKTLIQNTIAGQGSQVDIGGKLAEILGAIVDAIPSGETPRPIVMTARPGPGETTQSALDAIGLTFDEIKAAARGERTGVVHADNLYNITYIRATSPNSYEFVFSWFEYDVEYALAAILQFKIVASGGTITVSVVEL